jgi:hypothetical protein
LLSVMTGLHLGAGRGLGGPPMVATAYFGSPPASSDA